jgi:hypothetical protein
MNLPLTLYNLIARLRGQPVESAELRRILSDACEWTTARQDLLKAKFDIGSYQRYAWYQERGVIIFSSDGNPKVVADIQFVGSISRVSNTWLWAWANSALERPLTRYAEHVRHVGGRDGHPKLTTHKWRANETDGWEMTSLQAQLTHAEGVYRSPTETGATFLTLQNVRWATPYEMA